MTLNEPNTLFDDVIKNIESFEDIKAVVFEILVEGKQIQYNSFVYEKGILSEHEGRLIFLAYLKPLLNGKGFSFVEPQTRQNKRMDIVTK